MTSGEPERYLNAFQVAPKGAFSLVEIDCIAGSVLYLSLSPSLLQFECEAFRTER